MIEVNSGVDTYRNPRRIREKQDPRLLREVGDLRQLAYLVMKVYVILLQDMNPKIL
jgi:hypothetical protein